MGTVLRAPLRVRDLLESPAQRIGSPAASRTPGRVVTLDWMRGLVMLLMVIDHASMAFDGSHLDEDSAFYAGAARWYRTFKAAHPNSVLKYL